MWAVVHIDRFQLRTRLFFGFGWHKLHLYNCGNFLCRNSQWRVPRKYGASIYRVKPILLLKGIFQYDQFSLPLPAQFLPAEKILLQKKLGEKTEDLFFFRPLLKENPDVVIGTPGKVFAHLQAKNFSLKDTLEMLVLDEADLLFSFGYERDIQNIKQYLPEACQVLLTSATISEEILKLKKLFLHNPVKVIFQKTKYASCYSFYFFWSKD